MDALDDYFDYAMDLDEAGRAKLLQRLRKDDAPLAARLEQALREMVKNPDFLCQRAPAPAPEGAPCALHEVAVRVGDVDRAVAWYSEHFGCELVERRERSAVVALGAARLRLCGFDEAPPLLSIVAPNVAERGPSARRPDGVRALLLTDPWGNALEVVDRAGLSDEPR
jgi:catechol 2,3-dioxygenase-like lactoylglutathione lyase family enzyme